MNSVMAVARRELKTFFASPIAYIVLGGFLLLSGWFYFGPLFVAGEASLRGFFNVAPWVFLLLVPAVTMRAIAEERKSGTLELLQLGADQAVLQRGNDEEVDEAEGAGHDYEEREAQAGADAAERVHRSRKR